GPQTVHDLRTRQNSLNYMPTQDLLDRVLAPMLYPPGGSGRAARCSRTSAALIRLLRLEGLSHNEGRSINGLRFGVGHEWAPRPSVAHVQEFAQMPGVGLARGGLSISPFQDRPPLGKP